MCTPRLLINPHLLHALHLCQGPCHHLQHRAPPTTATHTKPAEPEDPNPNLQMPSHIPPVSYDEETPANDENPSQNPSAHVAYPTPQPSPPIQVPPLYLKKTPSQGWILKNNPTPNAQPQVSTLHHPFQYGAHHPVISHQYPVNIYMSSVPLAQDGQQNTLFHTNFPPTISSYTNSAAISYLYIPDPPWTH